MEKDSKIHVGACKDRKSYMLSYMKEYRKTAKFKSYMKEYSSRPEVILRKRKLQREYARETYYRPHKVEYRKSYKQREYVRIDSARRLRIYNEQYKDAAINIYSNGDACCRTCRNADIDVLCLDHIHNNGNEHRKFLRAVFGGGATNIYRMVKKLDYPPGFQVLCYNCNMKKEILRRRSERLSVTR